MGKPDDVGRNIYGSPQRTMGLLLDGSPFPPYKEEDIVAYFEGTNPGYLGSIVRLVAADTLTTDYNKKP